MKLITYIILILYINKNILAAERYVCSQEKADINSLITNFYIIEDKVIMSGMSGSGEYKIINKNNNGILAINSSKVGSEFGMETILLDSNKKIFMYKSLISGNNRNNLVKIKGSCDIFK